MDDATLSRMMQTYAEDAVDRARRFGVSLDYSEDSIQLVEQLVDRHHRDLPTGIKRLFKRRPSEETSAIIAKMFGGYIGEVFRRHHGGEWPTQMNVPGVAGPVYTVIVARANARCL